jgi:putative ATPase
MVEQKSLFEALGKRVLPLAEDLKPAKLSAYVGQGHLFSESGVLNDLLSQKRLPSLILWGPPGCGKTSLARLLAQGLDFPQREISATSFSSKELKKLGEEARASFQAMGKRFFIFVDEVHRLNKGQQDTLLPFLEDGSFLFVGATTENPSFEINAALLSRVHLLVLKKHDKDSLKRIYEIGRQSSKIHLKFEDAALDALALRSDGDARFFLNQIELLEENHSGAGGISLECLESKLPIKLHFHDKDRDQHYDLISAFHKALRASDTQAGLYYLERMLQAGEDRRFILRRMIRFASEDIGLADPQALVQTLSAQQAFDFIGIPEGDLSLYQATAYLATAPKSNAVYLAQKKVSALVSESGQLDIPLHLRNPVTKLMRSQGYGRGYQYDHDAPFHIAGQSCLPQEISKKIFFEPGDLGFEKDLKRRMEFIEKRRKK